MQFYELNYDTVQDIDHDIRDFRYPDWREIPNVYTFEAPVPVSGTRRYWTGSRHSWKFKPPKSSPSFKKVKQLRLIKMTELDVGERIHRNFTVKMKHFSFYPVNLNTSHCANDVPRLYVDRPLLKSSWTEVIDGDHLIFQNRVADYPFYTLDDRQELINETLNDVKSSCISDAFSGFDLLTNLAEAPETLGMIVAALKTAIHPLQGIKELIEKYKKSRARGKTHKQANADVSGQWMQYRYGIMPLVLSIKDAIELYDSFSDEFATSRAYQKVPYVESSKPLVTGRIYFHQESVGSLRFSAVGKARYSDPNLRLSDLITINPFLTAWELIPMSFVIDWFVNVGDVIFSHTSTLHDLAVQRKFCASVKKDYTVNTLFTREAHFSFLKTVPEVDKANFACGSSRLSNIPGHTWSDSEDVFSRDIITSDTYRSYDRDLFSPTDVEFKLNPSMSWMRYADAYVLSLKPILKILKSLK